MTLTLFYHSGSLYGSLSDFFRAFSVFFSRALFLGPSPSGISRMRRPERASASQALSRNGVPLAYLRLEVPLEVFSFVFMALYCVVNCHVIGLNCFVVSCRVVSWPVVSYHGLPCRIMACRVVSWPVMSTCHGLSCSIAACRVECHCLFVCVDCHYLFVCINCQH